jgi:hypothetical protein
MNIFCSDLEKENSESHKEFFISKYFDYFQRKDGFYGDEK